MCGVWVFDFIITMNWWTSYEMWYFTICLIPRIWHNLFPIAWCAIHLLVLDSYMWGRFGLINFYVHSHNAPVIHKYRVQIPLYPCCYFSFTGQMIAFPLCALTWHGSARPTRCLKILVNALLCASSILLWWMTNTWKCDLSVALCSQLKACF